MHKTNSEQRPTRRRWQTLARLSAILLLAGTAVGVGAAYHVGTLLSAPMPSVVGKPPADLPAQAVTFDSASGSRLSGWFVPGKPGGGAVLLLHGVGANRLQMLDRARFLHADGFAVLLFDFQAEGESPGEAVTFGYLEAKDARAAFDYLRSRTLGERVGVIGISLGGASAVLPEKPLEADAMVLEAVYASLEQAVENRMVLALGDPGRYVTPVLTMQLKPRLGFTASELQPAASISRIRSPVLLVAGGADHHATLDEMNLIFKNANAPKELWVIEPAGHVDFHTVEPNEYERRILGFLHRTLRR